MSGGVRDKVNEGFTNKLALVTPESKGTDARPDEDQVRMHQCVCVCVCVRTRCACSCSEQCTSVHDSI